MMQHCRGAAASARVLALVAASTVVLTIAPVSRVCAQDQAADMRACAAEKDDAARLRCYDRELARKDAGKVNVSGSNDEPRDDDQLRDTPRENDERDNDEGKAAAPPADPEAQFGYRGELAREELDRQAAQREQIEQLEAKVTEVSSQPHGELVVTLDNGQVWAQKSLDRRIRVKVGDQVVIKRAALGSFMLVTAAGRSTRVSRVQ